MAKNRFLQHVQKTEHINWGWFGTPHAAQRKLLPKCNFFRNNPQEVIEEWHFFTKKSEICIFYVIWFDRDGLTSQFMTWMFKFDCILLQCFVCSLYTVEKKMTKKWKKKKKSYLAIYPIFLEHVTPSAVPRRIFILWNQYY